MFTKCEICASKDIEFLYKQKFNNNSIFIMDEYDVCICNDCDFVFANNIPKQSKFDRYYERMSQYEFKKNKGHVLNSVEKHNNKIFNFIVSEIDKNSKILEIGCSTGNLLNIFKKKGYIDLLGIDPSTQCVEFTKKLYNINSIQSTINSLNLNNKFDLIILSSVVEHIAGLKKAFRKILKFLNHNGILFIEVPDVERFKDYIFSPYQQFSGEHIRYFSKKSIENLLNIFNLSVIKFEKNTNNINSTIDPNMFILVKKDNVSQKNKIKSYIDKSKVIKSKIDKNLVLKLKNEVKIIVWGVGTPSHLFFCNDKYISKILYFVDSNEKYKNKKMYNLEIKLPKEINENVPIVITSYSHQKEIKNQIKNLNLKNKVITIYE